VCFEGEICVECASKPRGQQLLHAARLGHSDSIQAILLHENINDDNDGSRLINQADFLGRTPLWLAAEHGHSDCVKLLLEADGVDVNQADQVGCTPLHRAVAKRNSDCMMLLIEDDRVEVPQV
jgi:ankyrin repeat protein